MRKKRKSWICAILSAALCCSACSGKNQQSSREQPGQSETKEKETDSSQEEISASLEAILPKETVTLDVYSQLSGYQGEQQGWFAQILQDKFHVKLNFISDGSEDFYDRQAKSGDLGDIVIWGTDSDQYHSAIEDGLLLDWEKDQLLEEYGAYMQAHMKKALEKNRKNSGGHIYGFGYDVATEVRMLPMQKNICPVLSIPFQNRILIRQVQNHRNWVKNGEK